MTIGVLLKLLDWLGRLAMAIADDTASRGSVIDLGECRVTCDQCSVEPWAVRWGGIRIGYDLGGWYSQLASDGTHRLLCEHCWQQSITGAGISTPERRS